jgi:hypothetical protein
MVKSKSGEGKEESSEKEKCFHPCFFPSQNPADFEIPVERLLQRSGETRG